MVFTSLDYGLLLCATAALYWSLPPRAGRVLLLAASLAFYAFWSVPFLGLLLAATAVGYLAGRLVEGARLAGRERAARAAVAAAACLLLGNLAVFKYADFALDLLAEMSGGAHEPLAFVLPLAISFYSFQILGYVIDVRRGAEAERNPLHFALFVAFFPQLVAGPIARAHQLLPQIARRPAFEGGRALLGLELLALGVVKKTVLADNLAVYVDRVHAQPELAGGLDVVLSTLAFGAQIYFDFSGYTDIARGSGRLLGIELPENFRSPYAARSVGDFWRRWHVTLSTWLRDYLYIPLGGNRLGSWRTGINLLVTMTLCGLWHGAGLTFVLWGAYHGLLLVGERVVDRMRSPRRAASDGFAPGAIATFVLVQAGWLLFRAEDLGAASSLLAAWWRSPLGVHPSLDAAGVLPLVALVYALHLVGAGLRQRPLPLDRLARVRFAAPALAASVMLVVVFGGASDSFIYFQF